MAITKIEILEDRVNILSVLLSAFIAESSQETQKHLLNGLSELKNDTNVNKEFIDVIIDGISTYRD